MSNLFRHIPSMDHILEEVLKEKKLSRMPRPMLRELADRFLDMCREDIRQGVVTSEEELAMDRLRPRLISFITSGARPHFRRVINATGVVVHTNLGRSLLAKSAVEAVVQADERYSNLEFDLATGKRGSRYSHVEELLCRLTGAEAGLVVNNNAAAVLLILDTLAKGKEVIVSRGELVEIGGSFRIPEVMTKSGAVLKEVGATNRTHARDYEQAIGSETAALMKVHTSNYRIIGFHKTLALTELVEIGTRFGLPVIEDLGSGNFYRFDRATGLNEPTVQDAVQSGAHVVCFSGDKLLGGPQSGIILGRREYIDRIKQNPMNRALRIDKMTLAALEATLRLYIDPERAREEIPTLRMITATSRELSARAGRLAGYLRTHLGQSFDMEVIPGESRVGGGALPEKDLPTSLVALTPKHGFGVDDLRDALLSTDPPLVGRIEEDRFCLDPRTLVKDEGPAVLAALQEAVHTLMSR